MKEKKPQNGRDNKLLAYELFVNNGLKAARICEMLGIAASQMSKWVNECGWKELQEAMHTTVENNKKTNLKLISDIQKEIKNENRVITSKEADIILKLANANEKMDKKADLSHYVEVGKEFCEYLRGLPEIEEWQEEAYNAMLDFMSHKATEFSSRR